MTTSLIVLGQGSGSLVAAAKLASSGRPVRLLELAGGHVDACHPDLMQFGPARMLGVEFVGPASDSVVDVPSLLANGGVGAGFQRRHATGAVGISEGLTGGQWLNRVFLEPDRTATLVSDATGIKRRDLTIGAVRGLLDVERSWFSGDAETWRRQLVGRTGGEVLEDVEVLEIEVSQGKVISVETDMGREWVEDALFFDCSFQRLAACLPRKLREALASPLKAQGSWSQVEALIQVDRVTLPNHALVADGNGVWRARVVHGLEDGVTRLVLDLGFNARGSAREETHQLVAEFLSRYSPYVEAYGESELYITEVNPPSLASLKVLEWLNRLGLYHVDQMGSWLSRC